METETVIKNKVVTVPKLRFKEFEEEWKGKILSDLTKINQGLQIAIAERFIEPIEGGSFYITNEFLREGSKKKYYIKNAPESVLCDEDDILMTRTGNTGQVVTGVKGAFHNNFFKIKYSKKCFKWFLFYFLTSHKIQHSILKLAGTSTIPDLNHSDFYKIKINLPSLPEQQKIASFLSAVDKKIQHLTRKKELLKTYKKGMMQELFSKGIKFKDEDGKDFPEWEEKKLGKVSIISMGQSPDSSSYNEEGKGIPLIQGNADIRNRISHPRQWTTEPTKKCEPGDLIMTVRAPAGYIAKSKHNACIGRGVCSIVNTAHSNIEFLFQFLLYYELKWSRIEQGSTFSAISGNDIRSIKIHIPSLKEQQKIADFLSAIDKKIEVVSQQIEKMHNFKKGLLQQMFI